MRFLNVDEVFKDRSLLNKWEYSLDKLKGSLYYSPLQTPVWFKFISKVYPKSLVLFDDAWNLFNIVQVLSNRFGDFGWIRHAPVPYMHYKDNVKFIKDVVSNINMHKKLFLDRGLAWLSYHPRALCNISKPGSKVLCRQPKLKDVIVPMFRNTYYSVLHDYDFEKTVIINLHESLKVSASTKRYFNKGCKLGLEIKESNDVMPLTTMLRETSARKGYKEWNSGYLINKYKYLSTNKLVRVFYVYFQNRIIYGAMYVGDKNYVVYDHGGGVSRYMYTNPAYFLHYSVMQKFKKEGYRFFDLGGVGGQTQKHPLYKNSQIKYRFGGEKVNFIHSFDIPIKTCSWRLQALYKYYRNKHLGWYN